MKKKSVLCFEKKVFSSFIVYVKSVVVFVDDPICPVNAFNEFMKRRPVDTLTPESMMYMSTLHNTTTDSTQPPTRSLWVSNNHKEKQGW